MSRPSSTSRLPSASDSPNSGIIHASGLSRSARCSAASFLARVVFPAPGSPTMRNSSLGPARPTGPRQADLSFTTETGAAVLAAGFSDVVLHRHEVPLAFPSARAPS